MASHRHQVRYSGATCSGMPTGLFCGGVRRVRGVGGTGGGWAVRVAGRLAGGRACGGSCVSIVVRSMCICRELPFGHSGGHAPDEGLRRFLLLLVEHAAVGKRMAVELENIMATDSPIFDDARTQSWRADHLILQPRIAVSAVQGRRCAEPAGGSLRVPTGGNPRHRPEGSASARQGESRMGRSPLRW